MGKHAQFVIGPAGSGKSTYCDTIRKLCESSKRTVHVVNLDPAAENFAYPVSIDVRDLISLEDVMEEMGYGPNGGLLFCMEYLAANMSWLEDQVDDFADDYLIFDCPGQIKLYVDDFADDYLIFDCPGQIELYSHLPAMKVIVQGILRWGYNACAVHLIDSLVITDVTKYISGTLMCLSAMFSLELPHINVLTKCDLVKDKTALEKFLEPEPSVLIKALKKTTSGKYTSLNMAMGELIEDFGMVGLKQLDITDQDSIELVLSFADHAMQYGEDLEPVDPDKGKEDEDENGFDAQFFVGRRAKKNITRKLRLTCFRLNASFPLDHHHIQNSVTERDRLKLLLQEHGSLKLFLYEHARYWLKVLLEHQAETVSLGML
eukprot:g5135.t1